MYAELKKTLGTLLTTNPPFQYDNRDHDDIKIYIQERCGSEGSFVFSVLTFVELIV